MEIPSPGPPEKKDKEEGYSDQGIFKQGELEKRVVEIGADYAPKEWSYKLIIGAFVVVFTVLAGASTVVFNVIRIVDIRDDPITIQGCPSLNHISSAPENGSSKEKGIRRRPRHRGVTPGAPPLIHVRERKIPDAELLDSRRDVV